MSTVVEKSPIIQHQQPCGTQPQFVSVKASSPHFSRVEEIFRSQIEPLYGNQDEALRKIRDGTDRRCEVLLYNDNPVGFVVYKKEIQSKYNRERVVDSFEVKNLVIIEPNDRAKELYGAILISRVMKLAERNFAKNLHITISEKDQKMIELLRSKDFSVGKTWEDKYTKGVKDFLFYINIPEKAKKAIEEPKVELGEDKLVEKERVRKRERSRSRDRDLERKDISYTEHKKRDREESPSKKDAREIEDHQRKKRETDSQYQRSRESMGIDGRREFYGRERSFSGVSDLRPSFYSETKKCHELTLKRKYIHQIKSGGKTVEGRINSGIVLRYKAGDQIRFFYQQNPSDDVVCNITHIEKYRSFREMLQQEGYNKCLTDVRSLEEAVRTYDEIPTYAERAARSGVVAIRLSLKK